MCPPLAGKAGARQEQEEQGQERSGTVTWPCALCTLPLSSLSDSFQAPASLLSLTLCNVWQNNTSETNAAISGQDELEISRWGDV